MVCGANPLHPDAALGDISPKHPSPTNLAPCRPCREFGEKEKTSERMIGLVVNEWATKASEYERRGRVATVACGGSPAYVCIVCLSIPVSRALARALSSALSCARSLSRLPLYHFSLPLARSLTPCRSLARSLSLLLVLHPPSRPHPLSLRSLARSFADSGLCRSAALPFRPRISNTGTTTGCFIYKAARNRSFAPLCQYLCTRPGAEYCRLALEESYRRRRILLLWSTCPLDRACVLARSLRACVLGSFRVPCRACSCRCLPGPGRRASPPPPHSAERMVPNIGGAAARYRMEWMRRTARAGVHNATNRHAAAARGSGLGQQTDTGQRRQNNGAYGLSSPTRKLSAPSCLHRHPHTARPLPSRRQQHPARRGGRKRAGVPCEPQCRRAQPEHARACPHGARYGVVAPLLARLLGEGGRTQRVVKNSVASPRWKGVV